MKDTKTKKKKKRSRATKPTTDHSARGKPEAGDQNKVINLVSEAFEALTVEEEANGDGNKAAEILTTFLENSEDPSWTSSVSGGTSGLESGSSSGSSVGYAETRCIQGAMNSKKGGSRQKRVVAVTGTVANVLGKEYVRASPRKGAKFKEVVDSWNGFDKEEVEQFLFEMLGDDLSMGVVRDVLCQCGYDVEKALEVLLDFSTSSNQQSGNGNYYFNNKEDTLTDKVSDCTSCSSESDLYDTIWSAGFNCRNYSQVLTSSEEPSSIKPSGESDLPQKVLESLFKISKSPEHEPSTMNWRNVVKKLQSLGPQFDVCQSSVSEPQLELCANGDEYRVFRKDANQHWNSVKSFYQKAAVAYSKGKWEYAAYLSDQGKAQTRLAQRADEKASQDIFKARNKGIENVITIDLHGQHVKQAMKLLKIYLLFGSCVPSVQTLRVITGCGTHGAGKSKLKQLVINTMEKENLEWNEENRGTILIKVDGYREFSFMDSESDSE